MGFTNRFLLQNINVGYISYVHSLTGFDHCFLEKSISNFFLRNFVDAVVLKSIGLTDSIFLFCFCLARLENKIFGVEFKV